MLSKNKKIWFFFIILLLALALRLPNIEKSLNGDEAYTVIGARNNLSEIIPHLSKGEPHPPLTYILLHFWLFVGSSDGWIRLLFILFGLGVCFVTYLLAKEYINEEFGLLSMFFVSLLPGQIYLSQYVRVYIVATFFISLSAYFFIKLLRYEHKFSNWLGYLISTICSLYTFYFVILFIIGENIFLFINWNRYKKIITRWILTQITILLLFSFWIPNLFMQRFKISYSTVVAAKKGFYIAGQHFGLLARWVMATLGLDPIFLSEGLSGKLPHQLLAVVAISSIIILFVVLTLAVNFFRKYHKIGRHEAYLFPVLVIVPIIVAGLWRNLSNGAVAARYFICISGIFTLILIAAIFFIERKKAQIILISTFCFFCMLRLPVVYAPEENWREAVNHIERELKTDDCIVFFRSGHSGYNYYANSNIPQITFATYMDMSQRTFDFLNIQQEDSKRLYQILKPYKRTWIILTHHLMFSGFDKMITWFSDNRYKILEESKFEGIELLLYERPI
ncbi:MAG: glycosyltransferase family 39 protein [Candidatus Omnitrophota bacterium]